MSSQSSITHYSYNFPAFQDGELSFDLHTQEGFGDAEAFALYNAIMTHAPSVSGTITKLDTTNSSYTTDYTNGVFS